MKPVNFPAANATLTAPRELPMDVNVEALPARRFGDIWTTVWQPTEAELQALAQGSRVILTILGTRHPPVAVEVEDVGGDHWTGTATAEGNEALSDQFPDGLPS